MSNFWRTALLTTAATATTAVAWMLIQRWSERTVQAGEGVARIGNPQSRETPRSREQIVEELTEDQQQQLLDELDQHL